MSSKQPELGPEFSISSQHASTKSSRSCSPVKHDNIPNPDDDAVNHQPGPSADPQRTTVDPPAPSASQKPGEVVGSTIPPFSLSLTLKNTGSVARDHLASERTFLAYVRTSLSFASAGVALVQLFRVSASTSANGSLNGMSATQFARPLGATLIAFGIGILGLGTMRYFATRVAPGVLPRRSPKRIRPGGRSRSAHRSRVRHPRRGALNPCSDCTYMQTIPERENGRSLSGPKSSLR